MISNIKITNNKQNSITIDIEGVIGVLEEHQFANPETAVATYEKFKTEIAKLYQVNTKEIIVNIRSAGGDVNDAILIYEILKNLPAKITTRCYGYVASAATIIAQAASENCREIASSALYLIHNSIGNIEGNSDDITQTLNLIKTTDETIAQIYAQRAGKESNVFTELMHENGGKGRWLAPKEAVEYGLVDKVIKPNSKITNNAEIIQKLGLPPIPENEKSQSKFIGKLNQKWTDIANSIKALKQVKLKNKLKVEPERQPQISREELIAKEMNEKIRATTKTKTTPKEDPSMDEIQLASNATAYDADSKQFK